MLQVVYTADQNGKYVVPFVDTTREQFLQMLKDLPEGVSVLLSEWEMKLVKDALEEEALACALCDRGEPEWSTLSEASETYIATYNDEIPASCIDAAVVLELPGDDVFESGPSAPLLDLYSYAYDVFESGPDAPRVVIWKRLNFEVDFDVDFDAPVLLQGTA